MWMSLRKLPVWIFFKNWRNVFAKDELGMEIARIAIPAALALTADPVASLIDTAFIGHIGPVELAAVGVAIAVFNQASRIAIFPLVSITTSFVAEEDAKDSELEVFIPRRDEFKPSTSSNGHGEAVSLELEVINVEEKESEGFIPKEDSDLNCKSSYADCSHQETVHLKNGKRHIASASTAMVIGAILGLIQAVFLICAAQPILSYMGVGSDSAMLKPARQYLTLRALGAPANLLSLAMQGVFRGFKDTKTPLYATVAGDAANVVLDPILIFIFGLGVSGAAIAHVISQYIICLILMWTLLQKVDILPLHAQDLNFGKFLKNGFLLLLRVIAVTFCVTLAASLSARNGSISMAAFQICLQVWLATSLLADGLAVAGQAILASAFAKKDFNRVTSAAARVLQLGLVLGLLLSMVLVVILQFAPRLFTEDTNVLALISLGIPFVAATQPINALAFIFDGINYGASDFAYSACSMIFVAIVSILCLLSLSSSNGFVGIWIALSIYMSFRALAGFWRIGTATGPWSFLK